MTRRRTIIAALAVAAVATAGAGLVHPWDAAAPSADQPSPSASTDSGQETAPPTPSGADDLEASVWWRIGWRAIDATDGPDFERLTVGRMNGDIIGRIHLGASASIQSGSGAPLVVGPHSGLLLYTLRIAEASELHLLDTAAKVDTVLVTAPLIHDAALAPTAGLAYFVTGPANPGLWRVSLDGTDEPELVARPPELGAHVDAVLATAPIDALPKQVTLRLDEDEARLAIFTCTDACLLRIIDLATGVDVVVEDLDPAFRELTDFIDGVVVIAGFTGIEADTGMSVPIPVGAGARGQTDSGWELPPGWSMEQRQMNPADRLPGLTWYVAIGPNGEEIPIEAMGQGIGQG